VTRALRVAVVFPDLLGTYGDGGNGLILARRAEWRGHRTELLQAVSNRPVPDADVFCLGGGEDGPQVRAARTRAVGEVVAESFGLPELPVLTGFENHGGRTTLEAGTVALGQVTHGIGNGDGGEGAVSGRVVGTYLHGPVLARNPRLADLLLSWALGEEVRELPALDDAAADSLRTERLEAVGGRLRRGRRRRRRVLP